MPVGLTFPNNFLVEDVQVDLHKLHLCLLEEFQLYFFANPNILITPSVQVFMVLIGLI